MVSGVGQGMGVLDCGSCASRGREGFRGFPPLVWMAYFSNKCIRLHAWKVDNISIQTIYRWKRLFIGFPKTVSRSKLGFVRNLQKCNRHYVHKQQRKQQSYMRLTSSWRWYRSPWVCCACVDTSVLDISVLGHFGPCRKLAIGCSGISIVKVMVRMDAVRGSDTLFPNYFGEDLFIIILLHNWHAYSLESGLRPS